MKNTILTIALFLPALLSAQQMTVTATVTNSQGVIYSNGHVTATLVDSTGHDLSAAPVNAFGQKITVSPVAANLDSSGHFSIVLIGNQYIGPPVGSQYQFSICSQNPGSPPSPTIPPVSCFTYTQSITSSGDISTGINAVAGGVSYITTGPTQFNGPVLMQLSTGSCAGKAVAADGTGCIAVSGGGVTASPQFSMFYQPNPGTTSAAQGDPLATTDGSGHVVAAALNGVYDLKGQFGATGSQQTMTCTATASSSTLTGCSGGDFKVGNGILIPSAGVSATVSTPAAPTVACQQLGSSCTGSVTYCYEISAIQAEPNGAMTAASAPTCSTQAAQAGPPRSTGDSTSPVVWTTIVLPSGTNINLYAVYKSVNGGPYNFYTLLPPQTMTDYNDRASIFTCGDVGIPCTAPASAVPNDVYAKITAVNGSTVTISAWSAQPKYYQSTGTLPGGGFYPSQPSISGSVTVQHDDTLAFYLAGEALRANSSSGQLQLHIPAGNYNIHSADPYGLGGTIHLNMIKNLTIAGDGDASRLLASNDRGYRASEFIIAVCGFSSFNPAGNCTSTGYPHLGNNGIAYPLVDPVPAGTSVVTLVNPSDSSHFTVGGYFSLYPQAPAAYNSGTTYSIGQTVNSGGLIYISLQNSNTGNTPASSPTFWAVGQPANGATYPADSYGELNKVLAIDSTSGTLTLAYPTNKMYSTALTPPYNQCTSCQSTPLASPMQPSGRVVVERLKMQDFYYRGLTMFTNWNAYDYVVESNLTIITNEKDSQGFGRHRYITNERLTEDSGLWGQGTYFATAAAGSGDTLVTGSHYINSHFANAAQPCSEGSVNIVWKDNVFDISGFSSGGNSATPPFMGGSTVAYGCEFANNVVNINNTRMTTLAGSPDGTGSGYDHGNTINIDKVGNVTGYSVWQLMMPTAQANAANTVIWDDTNVWNIGTGFGPKIIGSSKSAPTSLQTYNLGSVSGSVALYPSLTTAPIISMTLSGNISSFNFGSTRTPGLIQWLQFIQASSGGPYTLPALCSSWNATMDCNGVTSGPKINPAAGSSTYVQLWDDGTNLHIINSSYTTTNLLADWSNSGAVVNYVATCKTVSGGNCTSWGPAAGAAGGVNIVANVDSTGNTASIGNTTLFAVPSGTVHKYRVSCYVVVTTAAATSATVPNCALSWTDAETGVGAKGFGSTTTIQLGTAPSNVVSGTNLATNGPNGNQIYIRPAVSTNITYQASGYASNPANTMTYSIHLTVEDLGP